MSFNKLTGIHVHDVRGIADLDIPCEFYANKPNFLVAPNGSGKSSVAIAFASLNKQRLKLDKDNYRNGTDGTTASLEVRFSDGTILAANNIANGFWGAVDVHVINSGLYAKQDKRVYAGHAAGQASIRVPDIEVYKSIPKQKSVPYLVSNYRKEFPQHVQRGVSNLAELLKSFGFLKTLVECNPVGIGGARNSKHVEDFLVLLEGASSRKTDWAALDLSKTGIEKVVCVVSVAEFLAKYMKHENRAARLIDAVQVCRLYEREKESIRSALVWKEYEKTKREVNDLLASINTTGMEIKAHEKKGKLLVQLPERTRLSNGELDVLNFAASLIKATVSLKKDTSILVIDEVFDYLDDANLIVAQHYLLKMMERYKSQGKALFVIMLTHMDPRLMQSYRFRTKHISCFHNRTAGIARSYMRSLLVDRQRCRRDDKATYDDVSSRYLHFHPCESVRKETTDYLLGKGFPEKICDPEAFKQACNGELNSYLSEGEFDIAMACCALRVRVEEKAYEQLQTAEERERFLETHKTVAKLEYAEEKGATVPELHYLLGNLYNSCMHISPKNADGEMGLAGRALGNGVIRKMVQTACE